MPIVDDDLLFADEGLKHTGTPVFFSWKENRETKWRKYGDFIKKPDIFESRIITVQLYSFIHKISTASLLFGSGTCATAAGIVFCSRHNESSIMG